MIVRIRLLLVAAGACFALAAVVHAGYFEHRPTLLAEVMLALILLACAVASWLRPAWTRGVGLAALAVALLATLAGVFRIAIGLGPLSLPDIAYHLGMVVLLTLGLGYTARPLP